MRPTVIFALTVFSASGMADDGIPFVDVPAELHGKDGRFVTLTLGPKTIGKVVKVATFDERIQVIKADDRRFWIVADCNDDQTPVTYIIVFYTCLGDIPSESAVVRYTAESRHVKPIPPVPPAPPAPPADPLAAAIKAAYDADQSPNKLGNVKLLRTLYFQAVAVANDKTVETVGQLIGIITKTKIMEADDLKAVREVIGAELRAVLPRDPAVALTDGVRHLAAEMFQRVIDALAARIQDPFKKD